ncbi:MAG: 3-deoxy-7-phosphoheptulonate synthase [Verrucomicrobia bacterium]|nr:MAG: 3-deoxy-7-phosphoheptulonate synthase [Verrucomicrobiota bacterium]
MLIQCESSTPLKESEKIINILEQYRLEYLVSRTESKMLIGISSPCSEVVLQSLKKVTCPQQLIPIAGPYKMVSRLCSPNGTIIKILRPKKTLKSQNRFVEIGGKKIVLMAGPCAIESQEQLETISQELEGASVSVLRASAYKPRTSPYSFQGMGEEGLILHRDAQKKHQLLIETEIMDVRTLSLVADYVDIIRIGARNMQNYDLLKAVGASGKPVILKRGIAATVEEFLMSAEYLMAHGNHQVILCERGIRTFETSSRYTLDLSSVAVLKRLTHLPVIVDPSHAAGRKDIIPALCKAAIAVGADGLLVEVHHHPKVAKCDGNQALLPHEFVELSKELKKIANAIGRSL